ncbi:MAG TPA: LysM peptidoglycan-binding domain-containing protein [Chloroflexota bacterium]|jgi:LysM repeat protein/transposase
MFNRYRLPGLLSGLLLAVLASTGTAWAQTTNQNPSTPPVTVTLRVPTMATAASTTIQLQIRTDVRGQQTAIQITSDASPSAPTIIAASVGGDSVATVPVDASDAFVWAVSPNPTRPGCGPHPPAGTPGCSHAGTTTAIPQPGNAVLGPTASAAVSEDFGSSFEVAGAQATAIPQSSAPQAPAATSLPTAASEPTATLTSASEPVLRYTVQPGDTLTAVARRFYGDTAALDRIVQTNLGQPMPDGRTFADSNQIQPGWVLTLPLPSQVAYDQDGQCWYIVQPGDTLSTIAARLLGSANRWPELYALNSDRIAAPARIRVGLALQLPGSQPASASAQSGQDDGPVQADHPSPDATAPQQAAAAVPSTSAPGTSTTPTWASSLTSNLKPTTPGSTTPAGPAAAEDLGSAGQTASIADTNAPPRLELRSDRGMPATTADNRDVLLSRASARRLLPAAAAADATLLSIALGVWFLHRRSRTHLQPRLSLLAIAARAQPSSAGLPALNQPSPTSDTDPRARRRARVLQAVLDGALTHEDAAAQLDVSTRQLRRLLAAYRSGGVDALRHANAGRVPAHAVPDQVRNQIVELVRTRYAGVSQSELAQRLAAEHGIQLHRTTVRRILLAADLDASHAAGSSTESQAACDSGLLRGSAKRLLHLPGVGGGAVIRGPW